jgi:inorganic pyrophosphatase
MMVKPIGVLQMLDQGERDDKIIAVHCHDPAFRNFNDISELPQHRLNEIRSFFEDYKKNENKVREECLVVSPRASAQLASCRFGLTGSVGRS